MTEFKLGDKVASAVTSGNKGVMRTGVVERIHARTYNIPEVRMTIRDETGRAHVVSAARSVLIEADEYHTMKELYDYRMVYNALACKWFSDMGRSFKSWRHSDGELCFGGGWFIVGLYTLDGWATNHYKAEHWDLFDAPEAEMAPEWDGHTPAEALERLRAALG